ncbi:MAG TPA: L-2-amino-thiazoline-4-carboxylic acid hydrolase [Noviherbaspirillum sp.]|nr:L-2-amino-thiazoline-4-carboxylic acid hydrolase [Noviherbaspirillum sp.]
MNKRTYTRLDPLREKRRRVRILTRVVPVLLNRALKPVLGRARFAFVVRMLMRAPAYRREFMHATDDPGLKEVKQTFLLVGVLYNELLARVGQDLAFRTARTFLYELANAVQRQAYIPPRGTPRRWEWFHSEHEAQIVEGFIRNNENDGIRYSSSQVSLHITRCRFFEAFRDMGNAGLTEGFCRSDETVFNEFSPEMRFHRGEDVPNTIARGAARCTFIYDRITPSQAVEHPAAAG